MGKLAANTKYKVLTPAGFQSFSGISMMGIKPIIRLEFEQNVWLECTANHKIYVHDKEQIQAKDINIGDTVLTTTGSLKLLNKIKKPEEKVYDLIEVENGHRYYTNSILSSNCEFIIWEETLINSRKLAIMESKEPAFKEGQVRWWKKPEANHAYLVALDPSFGTGGDNSVIQVFELPDLIQVAEWLHNETRPDGQVRILADINQYIHDELKNQGQRDEPLIWYSLENNTLGDAALMVIQELGEDNIKGTFLSESRLSRGPKKFRKGFTTTTSSKKSACAKLKNYIERDHIVINSKNTISELKTFVASGLSFQAKSGSKDDCVMATLLAVRMVQELVQWDMNLHKKLKETIMENEIIRPMPIIIM